jgi:SAM-dependent methyltransferase
LTVWDDIFATRSWGRWPAEEVVRAVASLRSPHPLRVLEVGSGAGAQLWYLEHEGHDAFGVDVSRVGARRAVERLDDERCAARVAVADALRLPFPSRAFDAVLDVETLVYVDECHTADAWREVRRVLRPGGRLVALMFTTATYAWADRGAIATRVGERSLDAIGAGPLAGTGRTAFVDEDTVRALALATGMTVVDVQRRGRTAGPERHWIDELVVVAQAPA